MAALRPKQARLNSAGECRRREKYVKRSAFAVRTIRSLCSTRTGVGADFSAMPSPQKIARDTT